MSTSAVALLVRLSQHRAWVNGNLLEATASLSEADLHCVFEIGQGSILKSLLHMYAAEFVWLAALEGNDDPCCPGDVCGKLPGNQLGDGGIKSLAELREKWSAQEVRWNDYLGALSAASLDESVHRASTSFSGGKRFSASRSDVILHVCFHAHYTTAQVMNMLRHVGVEKFPQAMLTQLVWQEAASRG